jgi:hypothetical protein
MEDVKATIVEILEAENHIEVETLKSHEVYLPCVVD